MSNVNVNQYAANFWASVVARAWEDPKFKQTLLKDPEAALQEMGINSLRKDSATGTKLNIVVKEAPDFKCITTDGDTLTIYLPPSPDGIETLMFTGVFGPGFCS